MRISYRFMASGLILATLALFAPAAWANEKVYQKLLASAAFVKVKLSNGITSTGSGVLVDVKRKWILTNYHVVGDATDAVVAFPVKDKGKLITSKYFYKLNARRATYPGKVILRNEAKDLALIELTSLPADVHEVPLAQDSPSPGQVLHQIGNPASEPAFWLYSYGKVRQVYHRTFSSAISTGAINLSCLVILTTFPSNPGDSGGPVTNDTGELVGIVHGVVSNSKDMGILIDINEIRSVLTQAVQINVTKK